LEYSTMTSTVTTHDEALIREVLAGQEQAMRARDVAALVARFTPDAVTFSLAPPLRQPAGQARDADALRAWFAGFDGPLDYEIRDLEVTVGGDVAFCHSLNRLSATPRGMTDRFDLWFRSTVCLRKVAGVWLVAHEHMSTPFHMDGSMRAAVELRP
jgi:ketosteroid isomerase-like protein